MNRFYGKVGYAEQKEIEPGRWEDVVVEREYYGELVNKSYREQSVSDQIHDNLRLNTDIEIIANPYAIDHFSNIRYVVYGGTRWTVTGVRIEGDNPRINLTIGGVYNGPLPEVEKDI